MIDSPWQPLSTTGDWDQLDALTAGFHDGVIKEMHWSHREYVNSSGEMVYGGLPVLWILVQLQQPSCPAVELRFTGVNYCSISTDYEVEASTQFTTEGIRFSFSSEQSNQIVAKTCEYRLASPGLLGPGPFPAPMAPLV